MKKAAMIWLLLAGMAGLSFSAIQETALKPSADLAEVLKALKTEIETIFDRENVRSWFDQSVRLKEIGLSYQAGLAAPNRFDPGWSRCRIRQFMGFKLFDMIYAVAFLKPAEAAEAAKAYKDGFAALDLRAYADWDGRVFSIMDKAGSDPESVNVAELLDELTDNLIGALPVAMSNPETAHFVLDLLYGLTIESAYVMAYFDRSDPSGRFRMKMREKPVGPNHVPWMKMAVQAFEAFDRETARLDLKCEVEGRLDLCRRIFDLVETEKAGETALRARWEEISREVAAVRAAVLQTAAK